MYAQCAPLGVLGGNKFAKICIVLVEWHFSNVFNLFVIHNTYKIIKKYFGFTHSRRKSTF